LFFISVCTCDGVSDKLNLLSKGFGAARSFPEPNQTQGTELLPRMPLSSSQYKMMSSFGKTAYSFTVEVVALTEKGGRGLPSTIAWNQFSPPDLIVTLASVPVKIQLNIAAGPGAFRTVRI